MLSKFTVSILIIIEKMKIGEKVLPSAKMAAGRPRAVVLSL
nr:MAG TPA: hypothetical protein [Caudoviricetes sp.]